MRSLSSQSFCLFAASFPHRHHSTLRLSYIPIRVDPDRQTISSLTTPSMHTHKNTHRHTLPHLLPPLLHSFVDELCSLFTLLFPPPSSLCYQPSKLKLKCSSDEKKAFNCHVTNSCYGVSSELRSWLGPEEHNYISELTFLLLYVHAASRPHVHCSTDDFEQLLVTALSLWLELLALPAHEVETLCYSPFRWRSLQ